MDGQSSRRPARRRTVQIFRRLDRPHRGRRAAKAKPPRPTGIERNVVISSWEWATEKHFVHDLISSDRRHPTVNANGPLYGSNEYSSDDMPILDPNTHKVSFFKMPVADPKMLEMFGPPLHPNATMKPVGASAYWGEEKIWNQRANNHNGMFDDKGRVWFAASVRGIENPDFCKKGSEHPSAKAFPLWAPCVLDTNGNGKVDEYTEPGAPLTEGKDARIAGSGPYAVMPHPIDGSVWYAVNVFAGTPGFMRFDPKTKLSEFYAIPKEGIGVRGGDIDKNGVLWGSGSNGTLISFDRSKCKNPLNGPKATGNHCPEGFAFHKYPGPGFEGFENTSAEASSYTWVDHHDTVGLGQNIPISTANLNDGFVAFKDGQMVMLRIP